MTLTQHAPIKMPSLRDFTYHIERHGRYRLRCTLCNTGFMHRNGAGSHFESYFHRILAQKEAEAERLRILKAARIQRLHSIMLPSWADIEIYLGSDAWKRNMKVLMYDFITANLGSEAQIKSQYEVYCRMETTSLLELAVWKASICDYVHFESFQEVYDYSALEEGFDSLEFVKQNRITSGAAVIIPRVMEFLWNV